MANFNKVILIGNLTRDPQLSMLPSQTPVVEFGLAVNRRWKGTDNQMREETCFIDCRAYGRTADTINQYMNKGKPLLVEGRLQYDTWEGKDGVKRSKHRVIVEKFQFVGGPGQGGQGQGPRPAAAARPMAAPAPAAAPAGDVAEPPPPPYEEEPPAGEEIPF